MGVWGGHSRHARITSAVNSGKSPKEDPGKGAEGPHW